MLAKTVMKVAPTTLLPPPPSATDGGGWCPAPYPMDTAMVPTMTAHRVQAAQKDLEVRGRKCRTRDRISLALNLLAVSGIFIAYPYSARSISAGPYLTASRPG